MKRSFRILGGLFGSIIRADKKHMNYTFTFIDDLPADFSGVPILISGEGSLKWEGKTYLKPSGTIYDAALFEINHQYDGLPFKQAMLIGHLLAVGYQQHFYLFDLSANKHLLTLQMDGYFGHLYFDQDVFYVTDSEQAYCITKEAIILWESEAVGLDGVIIDHFMDHEIHGSGEWDPPGGWKDFVLDRQTGKLKK